MVDYKNERAVIRDNESYYGTVVDESEILEYQNIISKASEKEMTGLEDTSSDSLNHQPSKIRKGNLLYMRDRGVYQVMRERKDEEEFDFRFLLEEIDREELIYVRYYKFCDNIEIQHLFKFKGYSENIRYNLKECNEIENYTNNLEFDYTRKIGKESQIFPLSDTFLSKVFDFEEDILHVHI